MEARARFRSYAAGMTDFGCVLGNARVRVVAIASCLALAGVGAVSPAAGSTPAMPGWDSGLLVESTLSYGTVLREVDVSAAGVPVVGGEFRETAHFPTGPAPDDSISLTALPSSNSFVIGALDSQGTYFTWATQVPKTVQSFGITVKVLGADTPTDADDTIMVGGGVSGTAYFPSGPNDDSIVLSGTGAPRGFIAAMAPGTSHFAWVTEIPSSVTSEVSSIAVRANGDLLVAGGFRGNASFPTSTGSITVASPGADSGFVAQMAADDTGFAWVQRIGASSQSSFLGASVAVSADDTPYVSGHFDGTLTFPESAVPDDSIAVSTAGVTSDLVVAQLNTDDSYFAWAQVASSSNGAGVTSLEVDAQGSPVVVGYFGGSMSFPTTGGDDSITLTSNGGDDVYIARMNADDTYFDWAVGIGGTDYDYPGETQMTATGELLIPGYFYDTMQFPSRSGTIDLTAAANSYDLFVAEMDLESQVFTWAQQGGVAASDSAFGYAVNALADGRPILAGSLSGTMDMVGADPPITLVSPHTAGLIGVLGLPPTPPDPMPTPSPVLFPPSAPLNVAGEAGDAEASITWSPPASAGSFPITSYQAVASPGGQSCLVTAPALTCSITGLTNGTGYTATVRALNGAGWGPYSAASAEFTPRAPVTPSITITGTRGEVRGKPGIIVTGTSTDLEAGTLLQPWLRLTGRGGSQPGLARIEVSSSGEFTWQRRTAKKVTLHVASADGAIRSNRVVIPVTTRR